MWADLDADDDIDFTEHCSIEIFEQMLREFVTMQIDEPFNYGFRNLALSEIKKYSKNKLTKLAGSLLDNKNLDNFTSWGKTGIRAQLIDVKTKKLEMDFKFEGDEKSFHVLNAVSPAFTCAAPFSKLIVKNIKSKLN